MRRSIVTILPKHVRGAKIAKYCAVGCDVREKRDGGRERGDKVSKYEARGVHNIVF